MNKLKDQALENFIQTFSNESALPDERFKNALEKKLINLNSDSKRRNLFNPFNFMNVLKSKWVLPVAVVAVVGASGVIAAPFIESEYVRRTIDINELSAKVSANNQTYNASGSKLAAAESAGADAESSYYDLRYPATNSEYNYTESSYKFTKGAAATKCDLGYDRGYVSNYSTKTVTFLDEQGNWYSRDELLDSNGKLLELRIYDNSGAYTYLGGKYAVHEVYTVYATDAISAREAEVAAQSDPNATQGGKTNSSDGSDTVTIEEPLVIDEPPSTDYGYYFGENSEVLGVETVDGKKAYKIGWSYTSWCGDDALIKSATVSDAEMALYQEGNTKIEVVSYIDTQSYEILKEESYLDSVDAKNLIYTTQYSVTNSNTTFDKVKDNFVFNLNVKVNEIDVNNGGSEPKAYFEKELAQFVEENETLVLPVDTQLNLNWLEVNAEPIYTSQYYILDRNFYPSGSLGNQMLNYFSGNSEGQKIGMQELSASLWNGSQDLYVTIYNPSDTDIEDLMKSQMGTDYKSEQITLTIDTKSVSATKAVYNYESPESTYNTIVFEYEGKLIVLSGNMNSTIYTVVEASNAQDVSYLSSIFTEQVAIPVEDGAADDPILY